MTTWLLDQTTPQDFGRYQAARVTDEGAAWLASATARPAVAFAHWMRRPTAPAVLPCGTVFDVVNVEPTFGRRMLDTLWAEGPGCGPVATHRGRMLLFAAPGTAQRLPSLLRWEEWGDTVPRPLCHGPGDAVTVPPLTPPSPFRPRPDGPARAAGAAGAVSASGAGGTYEVSGASGASGRDVTHEACEVCEAREAREAREAYEHRDSAQPRWLVAPDARQPWLPGPEVLLWACVRAARAHRTPSGLRRAAIDFSSEGSGC
ncbi:bifunctional DNA primase/polymerase [Streptomyces sp. NPDC048718]|uniref:bifunctional DNA primase/polymerase n=1 Tax=Streptomyces sp. NPDC048718 TaxID=3365587 RepID=UPI00371CD9B1